MESRSGSRQALPGLENKSLTIVSTHLFLISNRQGIFGMRRIYGRVIAWLIQPAMEFIVVDATQVKCTAIDVQWHNRVQDEVRRAFEGRPISRRT